MITNRHGLESIRHMECGDMSKCPQRYYTHFSLEPFNKNQSLKTGQKLRAIKNKLDSATVKCNFEQLSQKRGNFSAPACS